MEPKDFIKTCLPFEYLSESDLELVVRTLEILNFPPETYILKQGGTPSAYLYLIQQGTVHFLREGEEVMARQAGETFGYPSMLLKESPPIDIVSQSEVVLYAIPEETFRQLVDQQDFAEFFLKELSQRFRETWIIDSSYAPGSDLARPVETLINQEPATVSPDSTIKDVALLMRERGISSVLVEGEHLGIVTIKAMVNRVLAEGFGPDVLVKQVMTHPIRPLPLDTPIYSALLVMLQEQTDHLVLTSGGQICGIISNNDLLRYQAKSPHYLFQQLEHLQGPDAGIKYSLEIKRTVQELFSDGLYVDQIGRIVASLNDALIKQLLKSVEAKLGPPPTPYAWLVFGSEGRMEQTLLTDQDNALVYLEDTPTAKEYFSDFSQRMVDKLLEVGFPLCPGGYMATNWHCPLAKWEQLFDGWINKPEPQALLEAAIFFDFRVVHGDLQVDFMEETIHKAKTKPIFLAHMARTALGFSPPLGFFRGIKTDDDGKVDLKKGAIAPIVSMARVYGIEAQTHARPTVDRLEAAVEKDIVSREGATALTDIYRYVLWLRLREQLNATEVTNKIELDRLSAWEKRRLKEALLYIRDMQDSIAQRFRTSMMG